MPGIVFLAVCFVRGGRLSPGEGYVACGTYPRPRLAKPEVTTLSGRGGSSVEYSGADFLAVCFVRLG